MSTPSQKAKEIFVELVGNVPPDEWEDRLVEASDGNEEIHRRVRALLRAHADPGSFLEEPAVAVADDMTVHCEQDSLEKPGTLIGPYKLLQQIGEGGMGVVYMAEQTEPVERRVALKIIKPGMDTRQVIARFEAEQQALAMMDHPNIAKVLDAGTTETGRPYFVMELVKGIPVTQYCDEKQLTPRERLELFIPVCQAAQHAHQKGIIHRDIKPSNVMVAEYDDRAVPKIIDFGVAKAIEQRLTEKTVFTEFGQVVGTVEYMSPEQAKLNQLDIDTRTDVYSLGVLLYELLTGETPVDRKRLLTAAFDEMLRIIREEEPPRPSLRLSSSDSLPTIAANRHIEPKKLSTLVRGELDWIVMKSLEKDRTRRYDTASKFAEDIQRYLADEPIFARPASSFYRFQKFVRRNRTLAASVFIVCLAICLGLVFAAVGFVQAVKQRDRALWAEQKAEERLAEVTAEQENKEAVIQLLSNMLEVPRGDFAYSEDRSQRELLDNYSSGLGDVLRNQPDVEIRLRKLFALAHQRFGEFTLARQQLQRALDVAIEAYGERDEHVADILVSFAHEVHASQDDRLLDRTETEQYAERAISIYDELGIETHRTAHALSCLVYSIRNNVERRAEIPQYLQRALRIVKDIAPDKDTKSKVWAMMDLILLGGLPDGDEEARLLFQEVLEMSQRVFGEDHRVTARIIAARGAYLHGQGDVEGAVASYREAWNIFRLTGRENALVGHNYARAIAEIYFGTDQHDKAFEVLDEVESLCSSHPDSLVRCWYLRGWGHLLREDFGAAAESLQQAVDLAEQHLPANHAYTALSRFHLARSLSELGRHADALKQYQIRVPLTEERVKRPNAVVMELYGHAWTLLHCGSTDDQTLRDALHSAERGLKLASTPELQLVKAIAQHALGEAEPAIETLRDGMNNLAGNVPHSRRELEQVLAQYLTEQGNLDEAEQVYQDGIAARLKHFQDKGHLQVALAEVRFGKFLREQGQFDRSEAMLLGGHEKLRTNPKAAEAHLQRAATELGELYEAWGKPEEAATWQAEREKANQRVHESQNDNDNTTDTE